MITLEDILPTLHELFIEKLPLYIEEINKEKNDGIIIQSFENKTLFENCQKLPCFKLEQKTAEYTEKDRIIENTVFELTLEIKTNKQTIIEICRYEQAIDKMFNENKYLFIELKIQKIQQNIIWCRIII